MKVLNFISTEMRVLFRSKASLVWFFIMPLVFTLFFGLTFEGSDQRPQVSLGIVNEDDGFLSRSLIDALSSEGFAIEELTTEGFEADDEAHRALFIPAGFTGDVVGGSEVTVTLKKREDANIEASSAAGANIYKAVFRLLGNLSLMELEGTHDSTITTEEAYNRAIPGEPRVTLDVSLAGRNKTIPSGFNQTVPGNVVMFVLMCVLIYGIQLLISEKKSGLLHRVSVGPVTTTQILAGKLASRVMAGVVQVIVLFIVSALLFDVYYGESWMGLILLMLSYVLCVAGISLLIGALVDSPEFASGLSILLTLIMAALGGCWWPLEVVPSPAREVAFVFPTGWAMDGLHKIMAFGYGPSEVLPNILVLTGMFLIVSLLAIHLMKKHLTVSH